MVLTGAWALILLLNGGLEGLVMSRMETILEGRDAALAMRVAKVLREHKIGPPGDIAAMRLQAADLLPRADPPCREGAVALRNLSAG